MNKEIDLPKMPWTVKVPMLELYALVVLCIATTPIIGGALFLSLVFLFFGLGLQHGREWVAELFVVLVVICGVLGSVLSFIISQNWIFGCTALAVALPELLICLPSSRQWFVAAGGMRAMKKASSGCLGVAVRVLAWVVSVPIAFVGLIVLLEVPYFNTISRLGKYESKDALILNEAEQVTKTFGFVQDGTNYTAVVLKPIGAFPSGPAVFVAGATGRIVDRCRDYGDNMRFRERWDFSWKDFRKEEAKTEEGK